MATLKQKRYNGRVGNAAKNIFFEDLMKSLAEDEKRIHASKPKGFISRGKIEKNYNFSKLDFATLADEAIICKVRGQTGLFFPIAAVRAHDDAKIDKVPADWISEQTIIRSYRKSDIPEGFPMAFRQYSRYGKPVGRAGRPTHFYSRACLLEEFGLKVLEESEPIVWEKSVAQGAVSCKPMMCLRLTSPPSLVALAYSGPVAKKIIAAKKGQEFPEPDLDTDRAINLGSSPFKETLSEIDSPAKFPATSPISFTLSPHDANPVSPNPAADITPTNLEWKL